MKILVPENLAQSCTTMSFAATAILVTGNATGCLSRNDANKGPQSHSVYTTPKVTLQTTASGKY